MKKQTSQQRSAQTRRHKRQVAALKELIEEQHQEIINLRVAIASWNDYGNLSKAAFELASTVQDLASKSREEDFKELKDLRSKVLAYQMKESREEIRRGKETLLRLPAPDIEYETLPEEMLKHLAFDAGIPENEALKALNELQRRLRSAA